MIKFFAILFLILLTSIGRGHVTCMEHKEDPAGLYNSGVRYYNGLGVNQDKTEAVKLFHKAADLGQVNAQFYLGICYDKGTGVNQDKTEAAKLFHKAAIQGDAKAQFRLGEYYDTGEGVTQDKLEAANWFHKAAEQGDAKAQFRLGEYYDKGEGVTQDRVEAVKLFHKTADQGHVTAQLYLGMYYDKGTGVNQDKAEAVRWYRKAADQGQVNAQFRLAACYEKGEGVAQDKAEAAKWYKKAADQGNALAGKRLNELKNELLDASRTANQPQGKNSNAKINHENLTNKKLVSKETPINNTNTVASQKQTEHSRKNNQKKNIQKALTPEELKKAEEASQKAMEELLAEEAKSRKNKRPIKSNTTQVKEAEKAGNKKGKGEPEKTIQIKNLKKETDKSSEKKLPKIDKGKVGAGDNLSTTVKSPQTQKQANASKQKPLPSKAVQTPQAVNNKNTLASSVNQNKNQEPTHNVGKIKEMKQSNPIDSFSTQEIKEQEKNTGLKGDKNEEPLPEPLEHTEHKAICLNPNASVQGSEEKDAIGANQQSIARDQQDSISTETKEEGKGEKEKGTSKPAKTTPITIVKRETDKPYEKKPNNENLPKIDKGKVGAVDNLLARINSSQTQKQGNAPKQDTHPSKVVQATQAVNNKNTLASPRNQNRKQEPTHNVGKTYERKKPNPSDSVSTQEIKEQEKKTGSKEEQNNNSVPELMDKTEHKAICLNSNASAHNNEGKIAIGATQQSITRDQQEPINNLQSGTHKQKKSKNLWYNVKDQLRKKKTGNYSEVGKEIKKENNKNATSSPSSHLATVNSTTVRNGESEKASYYSGQIRYVRVPIPILVKIPVYIPVPTAYPPIPTTYSHDSVDKPKLWVPYTQITYEDNKRIVAQWNDEGRGSVHVMHPDSDIMELEESYLHNRLRHLKSCLQRHGYPVQDQWNMDENSSSHIIHHGGEAAKEKNDELKKRICYLEKFLQEKGLDEFK